MAIIVMLPEIVLWINNSNNTNHGNNSRNKHRASNSVFEQSGELKHIYIYIYIYIYMGDPGCSQFCPNCICSKSLDSLTLRIMCLLFEQL